MNECVFIKKLFINKSEIKNSSTSYHKNVN